MLGRSLGEAASTSSVGLAMAAATIATAFVVAELMVGDPAGMDGRDSSYASASTTGLSIIVADGGRALQPGVDWVSDPDQITRFGLAKQGQPNFLDYAKIRALRNGTMVSAPNDHPDYPEVKAALGITEGDFHLRSYPVIPGLDDPRWTKEPHGRLAYVARYSGATAAVQLATNVYVGPKAVNVTLDITNAAATAAIFQASVGIGNRGTDAVLVSEERHTPLLAPGATYRTWVEFPSLAWSATVNGVRVEVQDPYGNPAVDTSGALVGPKWHDAAPPTASPVDYGLRVHAADFYVESGKAVEFVADHYRGDGSKVAGAAGQFVLVGPDGKEWVNTTATEPLPKGKNDVYTHRCTNCTTPGTYVGVLWDKDLKRRHFDVVHVSAGTLFKEKKNIDPIALREIGLLKDLVVGFNPTQYDPVTNPEGDVFSDDTNGPSDLVGLLGRYTTLVVGSEVSQTALNPAAVKYGIAQWVQEGGNLVVLGTYNRESRWLEPVYHAAQNTANGGISAPDPTHPILLAPNRLSYDRYLDRARAWDVDNDAPFTHVLSRAGSNGKSQDDTLAVSHPGAYNNGTVVLTSYIPGSLTSPQDDAEAKRLLHNLLSQSYTMLFLDYGPPIPSGVPVGSDSRLAAVEHPNVPGAVVEVRLVMYVFG